jgi:hypothetical protein
MDKFATLTGRSYHLFDYAGAADAMPRHHFNGIRCRNPEKP